MQATGSRQRERDYIQENSRGYQTRGRSLQARQPTGFGSSGNDQGLPEENLQLVPCRWSHTGWKYVQADPSEAKFFKSPNRVNSFGFNQTKKAEQMKQRGNRSVNNRDGLYPGESEFQTSYARFFNPSR